MKPVSCALRALVLAATCFWAASPPRAEPAAAAIAFGEVAAAEGGSAIFAAPAAGRYSFTAKSPVAARIELVDMIAGPIGFGSSALSRDARVDALLDKGAYKLRLAKAEKASGKARLVATPFVELNQKPPALVLGRPQSGELGDLRQRSYALEVGPDGRVSIEALGRALSDLRLWRENGELVDLSRERSSLETKPGRAMTRLRLEGLASPGHYLVTAYGGEAAVWPEGDAAQPFMLRIAPSTPLDAGLFEGVIGPFGSARFTAPAIYDAFRLELPQPAPARLFVKRAAAAAQAAIGRASREAYALASRASDGKTPAEIEISGFEGQSFSLRAARREARFTFEGSGPHLVAIDLAGEGGDEIPASALLARVDRDGKAQVLAADAPRLANGRPWRGKFNLRGPSSLLFEMTEAGPVAIDAKGVTLRATIEPALGALAARADGETPNRYDLAPGFYKLVLEPSGDAAGVVDVTLGAPGLAAPEPERRPARASASFGVQTLDQNGSYLILGNVAPQMLFGPRVVALPADLAKGPLPLWQGASETIAVPLRIPKGGAVVAKDSRGAEVLYALGAETTKDGAAVATATILPSGHARAIGFSFVPEPTWPDLIRPESAGETAEAGAGPEKKAAKPRGRALLSAVGERPIFFDLGKDETQELRLDLPEAGLYRVESLGRLKTSVRLGARVVVNLGSGEDNGPGHNGQVTGFLRAGAYRASVTAKDSSGRAGFAVAKAALEETPVLRPGGRAHARLGPGVGAAIPIEIAEDGLYALDLIGVGRTLRARLEDSEGWPLAAPGPMRDYTSRLAKGTYRLVVMPEDVDARALARLRLSKTAEPLSGHGPHALPFDEPQKLEWREPQAQGAPRDPDVWRFSLFGDADVALSIGEGMIAELFREKESVGKLAAGRDFKKRLGAGDYRVEARALAGDDRLDYEISLASKELQPGKARRIALPARIDFALAQDRVVDLASFGGKEILATLKDASGAVVEQAAGGERDWNLALSRRLHAGAFTLELAALGARPPQSVESKDDQGEEGEGEAEKDVEVALALPPQADDGALAAEGTRRFSGASAHMLAPPKTPQDALALVAARSSKEIALALEKRGADGVWREAALRRGLAPFLAWPAPADDGEAFRILAWPVGGGDAEIEIGARAVARGGQSGAKIGLEPAEGLPSQLCVGLAALAGASVVDIGAPPEGLALGSSPGRALEAAHEGATAPQSERLWLVAPGDCKRSLEVKGFAWSGEEISLDLAARETAQLPKLLAPGGKTRLWLARSEQARVGLDAGAGMAFADDATLALAGAKPLRVWNASGEGAMRVALRAIDVDLAQKARADSGLRATLPKLSALPVALAQGGAPLSFELPAHTAVFAPPVAFYAGSRPLSATWSGVRPADAQLLLVNLSDAEAPVAFSEARNEGGAVSASRMVKRFFDARGEIALPVEATKGDRLYALGGDAHFIAQDGRVSRQAHWGRKQSDDVGIPIDGPGLVIFDHPPGLAALWLEAQEKSPWTIPAARAVAPPQQIALSGGAQSFTMRLDAPALLTLHGGAPAFVAVTQNGRREAQAFPEGVDLRRYLGAGEATIDVHGAGHGALSGALDVALDPIAVAHEGVNDPLTLAPGGAALFSFEVKSETDIGLGLRAEPDVASMRVFAADGKVVGEGLAQLRRLAKGRYVVEARAPHDAPLCVVRLTLRGLGPPPATPPDDVVADMLQKAGLKKTKTR